MRREEPVEQQEVGRNWKKKGEKDREEGNGLFFFEFFLKNLIRQLVGMWLVCL